MSGFTFNDMTNEYMDVLKEIGNIGAGNATTALASMLQQKVDMKVPKVDLMEFKEVGLFLGGEDSIMAGVYLLVEGDINGSMMFLSHKKAAKHMVNQLLMGMGHPEEEEFDEMELSALKELGNIMTGSYLNALSDLTRLKIFPSVPEIKIDMAGAILSAPAIEFATLGDKILMIQTNFTDELDIDGYFILVPDLDSYDKIMKALGMA
ncbi:MAG: chemotaxis protein CheC [Lachnospiraceae bacterium]|nr:chemotaxis protein CheC [Lachnospiraceae bacterium]MBR1849716.1 chemotaxis protein CheC [Lachnospiraceae bacterium]